MRPEWEFHRQPRWAWHSAWQRGSDWRLGGVAGCDYSAWDQGLLTCGSYANVSALCTEHWLPEGVTIYLRNHSTGSHEYQQWALHCKSSQNPRTGFFIKLWVLLNGGLIIQFSFEFSWTIWKLICSLIKQYHTSALVLTASRSCSSDVKTHPPV